MSEDNRSDPPKSWSRLEVETIIGYGINGKRLEIWGRKDASDKTVWNAYGKPVEEHSTESTEWFDDATLDAFAKTHGFKDGAELISLAVDFDLIHGPFRR
jgi:hypothetical protein